MAIPNAPFHPIIYVRGYAMTPAEIDATSADPFCGFNLGSTVYRAVADKARQPRKFVFESPVVRLASEFDYCDVYEDGCDILDPEWRANPDNRMRSRSIIVYRYYDEASRLLGLGKTPEIEKFSSELSSLILCVRDLVCGNPENGVTPDDFRCYLVAHSMGGLVCRGLLQNPKLDKKNARRYVEKFFTYATPHNGIEMGKVNVPAWLSHADMNNFKGERMADYLNLKAEYQATGRVDWMPAERFPAENIFCMVGTNRLDYEAALGMSRTFAGHGSDGLVRIENATLTESKADGTAGQPCGKAFAFRAHSGFFGIVNSEEAYQNLIRFLFGDVRVDIWVDVDAIRLPPEVEEEERNGKTVNAIYQFEVLASPRGKPWFLTRRMAEEDSVGCLTHQEWLEAPKKNGKQYLSTVFLANRARVNRSRPTLAYSLSLGIRVPDYEVDRRLWFNEHYEGRYLFRNSLILELTPPDAAGGRWKVSYAWQDQGPTEVDQELTARRLRGGKVEVTVPFGSNTAPGISGRLRFVVSGWNESGS